MLSDPTPTPPRIHKIRPPGPGENPKRKRIRRRGDGSVIHRYLATFSCGLCFGLRACNRIAVAWVWDSMFGQRYKLRLCRYHVKPFRRWSMEGLKS